MMLTTKRKPLRPITRSTTKRVRLNEQYYKTAPVIQSNFDRVWNDTSGLVLNLFKFIDIISIIQVRKTNRRLNYATYQENVFRCAIVRVSYSMYTRTSDRKKMWKPLQRINTELQLLVQRLEEMKPSKWRIWLKRRQPNLRVVYITSRAKLTAEMDQKPMWLFHDELRKNKPQYLSYGWMEALEFDMLPCSTCRVVH